MTASRSPCGGHAADNVCVARIYLAHAGRAIDGVTRARGLTGPFGTKIGRLSDSRLG